ncbi:MAG: HAMP domain-containing histidine kinase [Halieaceae bacterium]|nr:HAMP domain-containing histidine kinase [Halieaceae bacterium]
MMSLRWRILGAFILVILFTILLSVGVDYWSKGRQLSQFSAKIRSGDLAGILSRTYTDDKNWNLLEPVLVRTGFLIDPEKLRAAEAAGKDHSAYMPMGVVVRDIEGNVIMNTFSALEQGAAVPQIEGDVVTIFDLDTEQAVGTVAININRAYLAAETREFLIDSLVPTAIGGLITAMVALLLAFWLSRRITAPVIALTEATQVIAESGDTRHLPVNSSDELGQMSASFNQMMTSLDTQRHLRKRLIDDVSHELNTPLSVIRLEAQGMSDGIKPPADAAKQIMGEVDMLGNLVHDLNWLAETDAGALRLNLEPHSPVRLLTTSVERWQLQAKASDVELTLLPLSSELPPIRMDTVRIRQALGNLIQNGLQYTPAGGHVTVQCEIEENRWIEIAVRDTGPGIAAKELPFVFERFYRADPSRQKGTGGQGLGLAIVKQIAEAHGGQVWAESEAGKGSCFYLRLPIQG